MWFEKITNPFKTNLFPMCILFIPALLMCLNPWQTCASSNADSLDPALILLRQAKNQNSIEEKTSADKDNIITTPEVVLKSIQCLQELPQFLSPDERFMYFSTTDVPSENEHTEPVQLVPGKRQLTQKEKLLRTSMSSVIDDANNQTKQTLNNLIGQISSMKIRPKTKENKPESQAADEEKNTTGNDKETDKSPETETAAETQEPQQTSANALNPEIVKKLERIIEQSASTDEPQLLADMLYQSGYYELAAYFYEMAVTRGTKEQINDADKVWLMMQKAVCLSNSNPQQALQIYKSLTSQYPVSPWTDLAKNYGGLLDWLEAQQPKKLIEQCKKDIKAN